MSAFLIFPHQLFNSEKLLTKKEDEEDITYYLIEDPIFFGYREERMKFNQLKCVLHRASMKYYHDYLEDELKKSKSKLKPKIEYIDFSSAKKDTTYNFLKKDKIQENLHIFDPVDHLLLEKITKIAEKHKLELVIHETPNFLTPLSEGMKWAQGRKKFFHHQFYEWQKKRMNILKNTKSYDNENRKSPPKTGLEEPDMPTNPDLDSKYVKEAIKYVKKHFKDHYGDADNFIYPITHETSEKWFQHFLKNRFNNFGQYQDAITKEDQPFLYHSVITPMLNIGLLDPLWIVEETTKYYQNNKKQIKINNYEGYIRQVIGWREYSRVLYQAAYEPIKKGNYFNHKGKLNSKWYTGTTGIKPIDDTIISAFKTGYLHHILRLMMMSNFMNLCQLHPDEVYKWMMEFSVDSYDWVMTNNVYSMGLYADGGLTMRKPYLSSSNYILKMSNYKKDKHWETSWTTLYHYFLGSKTNELKKTALIRNLGIWEKKTSSEKSIIKNEAQELIKDLTN